MNVPKIAVNIGPPSTHSASRLHPLWALVCGLLLAHIAQACNVPVFRYALERWRPDHYEVLLFHRGELTEDQQKALAPLHNAEERDVLTLAIVPLDKPLDAELQKLWDSQKNAEAPWMMVLYPQQLRIELPVWSGRFDADVAKTLVDSPIRQQTAKRLMNGETAVWLMLESADAKANDEAAKLVQQQIKELEKTLELPELTASPDDEVHSAVPIKVAFSLLKIARDDPKEQLLIEMLLGSEPDLKERTEPIVFPVFGRGRALFPLIGAGITAENIADSAGFLVGPCSCQVKGLNPGFDLLNLAEWDRIYGDDATAVAAVEEQVSAAKAGVPVAIPTGVVTEEAVGAAETAPVSPDASVSPASTDDVAPSVAPSQAGLVDTETSGGFAKLLANRPLLIGGAVLALAVALVALAASKRAPAPTRQDHE